MQKKKSFLYLNVIYILFFFIFLYICVLIHAGDAGHL